MLCVHEIFAFVFTANPNHVTIVKNAYVSTKMAKKCGLSSLMVSRLDVPAVESITVKFLLKITDITSALTMQLKIRSVQSLVVIPPQHLEVAHAQKQAIKMLNIFIVNVARHDSSSRNGWSVHEWPI